MNLNFFFTDICGGNSQRWINAEVQNIVMGGENIDNHWPVQSEYTYCDLACSSVSIATENS